MKFRPRCWSFHERDEWESVNWRFVLPWPGCRRAYCWSHLCPKRILGRSAFDSVTRHCCLTQRYLTHRLLACLSNLKQLHCVSSIRSVPRLVSLSPVSLLSCASPFMARQIVGTFITKQKFLSESIPRKDKSASISLIHNMVRLSST